MSIAPVRHIAGEIEMSASEDDEEFKEELPSLGVYEGERNAESQRHGHGRNVFTNGDIYEGNYALGERNGPGVYKWKAGGARYTGEYMGGSRNGNGFFVYPDGSKYRASSPGGFMDGKRHGIEGIYSYANGDIYVGGWKNDLKDGKGVYIYKSGSKKTGVWVDGVLNGQGEIIHADHKISGHWTGTILSNRFEPDAF
ncbi:hypothetical protein HK101_008111 [Irineochytrium annulatum]|nr:hypothetical protein HK101_008111 [Irineochytrium annulatum]